MKSLTIINTDVGDDQSSWLVRCEYEPWIDALDYAVVVPHDDEPVMVTLAAGDVSSFTERERMDLEQAAGRIAAEACTFALIS